MGAMRRCLRCGHEWSQRSGTQPKTCPRCRSPYWNRQRRGEEMSPIAELERALEERRSMELNLQNRRAELQARISHAALDSKHLQDRIASVQKEIETLHRRDERTGEQEQELLQLEEQLNVLSDRRCALQDEAQELECMLQTLEPATGQAEGAGIDRDLLLEALDDDAENELYAEGAQRYARQLAERVRDGEFDGD